MGSAYSHHGQFDEALKYHSRALSLYEAGHPRDSKALATTLTGIAIAHHARKDLNEALDYAQRAWTLTESNKAENDIVVAQSLALLTSIHHDLGDDAQALKLGTRALGLYERSHSINQKDAAELLNTLGLGHIDLGDLSEARACFERALTIYIRLVPSDQSNQAKTEKNLQLVLEMQQNAEQLQYYSWGKQYAAASFSCLLCICQYSVRLRDQTLSIPVQQYCIAGLQSFSVDT